MISLYRHGLAVIVSAVMGGLTMGVGIAFGDVLPEKATDGLPIAITSVPATTASRLQTAIQWDGHEYDIDTGIELTMNVIRNLEESSHRHELALIQLAMLKTQLNRRPCLDELATMYGNAKPLEKQLILTCFLGSRDPRAIPMFVHTLDKEQNMKLRLLAAGGLAGWNIRRGVGELVKLLDSKEVLANPTRTPSVRDYALDLLRAKNRLKGWGFPATEWWKSNPAQADLDRGERKALYISEIKTWWAENQHRFPNWKPGDPLPDVETNHSERSE